ncbi:tRNA (adenosine(37)-N6)-threonylcarbamoyltransferase complex dimerization subunit type 1 TsaB [Rhodoferax sp. U2-2l]|uniref:tRNA (adenosine(37)-N6)-threonylcarbamoyltransferase complex dimerization subunit type 1 TsaB n=1 Tax=Rhodoferax sp. U2-2l TaxID=2884000 RepID=UPI001D0AA5BB|nr:tRNA (adenosine(37)-N6)-threonylcarbamoyltransferase complex dimerization subunit type 1 TsaB [Rhodoferax sp. U2-2l]MCB8746088.1 tRNA (adenosine(37)-N6)-threonylcarbamoyltransferase complex dimerization subunit type 1 TsaB [Rhodoferax sp. U2-2l]
MNLLALDTSTEQMSMAVQRRGVAAPWQHTAAGGAHSSTHLIPEIQRLMVQADLRFDQLDAIVFGAGPGSFTGLRTACSVAQGLAFGAGVPVLPVDTLLAVAEDARWQLGRAGGLRVTALLDARMDELYAASYDFGSGSWTQHQGYRLIKPEALAWDGRGVLAGNVFAAYGARLPDGPGQRLLALPTASAMLRLAPALLAAGAAVSAAEALPTYIRDKVAQTTLERAAAKAGA